MGLAKCQGDLRIFLVFVSFFRFFKERRGVARGRLIVAAAIQLVLTSQRNLVKIQLHRPPCSQANQTPL